MPIKNISTHGLVAMRERRNVDCYAASKDSMWPSSGSVKNDCQHWKSFFALCMSLRTMSSTYSSVFLKMSDEFKIRDLLLKEIAPACGRAVPSRWSAHN